MLQLFRRHKTIDEAETSIRDLLSKDAQLISIDPRAAHEMQQDRPTQFVLPGVPPFDRVRIVAIPWSMLTSSPPDDPLLFEITLDGTQYRVYGYAVPSGSD